MAILDLQRREMEQGRIRFGNKKMNDKGKEVPNRLDHPLLTSPDRDLIDVVAVAYGAESSEWPGGEGQWQTELHEDLRILVPVSPEPCVQWWERWSGGGCLRRCDGVTDTINDQPCDCNKGAEKRACNPTSRIAVLLPETGDARWRIESKSLHAAIELPAALERATGEKTGEIIPGVLRVEQRRGKKGNVPVPVIRLDKVSRSAAGSAAAEQPEGVAPSGGRVEPSAPVGSGAEGSPATVMTEVESAPDESNKNVITQKQIAHMMAVSNECGVSEADLKTIVADIAGVKSRKLIPVNRFDAVLTTIRNWAELKAMSDGEG